MSFFLIFYISDLIFSIFLCCFDKLSFKFFNFFDKIFLAILNNFVISFSFVLLMFGINYLKT